MIETIFERQNKKKHIQELRLTKVKFANKQILLRFVKAINEGFEGILALRLHEITLNDTLVFNELNQYIGKNHGIIDLNLQGCGLLSSQLLEISETLS